MKRLLIAAALAFSCINVADASTASKAEHDYCVARQNLASTFILARNSGMTFDRVYAVSKKSAEKVGQSQAQFEISMGILIWYYQNPDSDDETVAFDACMHNHWIKAGY